MPSFDVVSEVDKHELANALDQANREVGNRFDFKGTGSKYELEERVVTLHSQSDFQLKQMLDILRDKLTRRGIDIACLKIDEPEILGREARQRVTVREGLETTLAKEIVKLIKDSKLKVQAAIQGETVRVTGKKKDDLQDVIALLRKSKLEMPLQFKNFRD
jgi:uncharacterized protein YajQ (UPF0234 family)